MKFILSLFVRGIAVFATAYILPGVVIESYWTAVLVALVLTVLNTIVKPILFILTLPITIMTLGLFTFVLNAVMILLVDYLIVGFSVGGFLNALLFSLLLSLINSVLEKLTRS